MPLHYVECFGRRPGSPGFAEAFRAKKCPFTLEICSKRFGSGIISGACTLAPDSSGIPVVCCPKRLYADGFETLREVSRIAFGPEVPVVLEGEEPSGDAPFSVLFGQKQGKEIRVPFQESGSSSKFSVDWIIALVSPSLELIEFVAVEVQTIDTTGNYQRQFWNMAKDHDPGCIEGRREPKPSSSSFNFENVNKRILPQLITKGHILRREKLCKRGLFFVCPTPVLERIILRVGELPEYPPQTGSITLLGFQLDTESKASELPLFLERTITTTSEQLSLAFSSPKSLPAAGVYEEQIELALRDRFRDR